MDTQMCQIAVLRVPCSGSRNADAEPSQKALDTTISTTMGHKTSRKKSDESVLSLSEVTKYVVLTGSRRPSISEYCRTLASKMTINDALSWNSEEFVRQQENRKSPVWKILILRILQDSVPSVLPLHIDDMDKIQYFPGWGNCWQKIDLLEFYLRSFEISRSMRDWIPRSE